MKMASGNPMMCLTRKFFHAQENIQFMYKFIDIATSIFRFDRFRQNQIN